VISPQNVNSSTLSIFQRVMLAMIKWPIFRYALGLSPEGIRSMSVASNAPAEAQVFDAAVAAASFLPQFFVWLTQSKPTENKRHFFIHSKKFSTGRELSPINTSVGVSLWMKC